MQNKSLGEQLEEALQLPAERRRVARSQSNRQNDRGATRQSDLFPYFYRRPQNPPRRGDGQDHINIYSHCKTDLGAALYCETMLEFTHDMLGRCASVKSAWDFLAFGASNRRVLLAPTPLRRKMLNGLQPQDFEQADFVFMDITWAQVNSHPMLKEAIIESTLPFDSYRIDGAMALSNRHPFSRRLIEAHEIIRVALKSNQEPDFTKYTDGKTREEIFAQFKGQVPESRSSRKNNSLLRALDRMPAHVAPKKPTNNKRQLPPVNPAPDSVNGVHRLNYCITDPDGKRVQITPDDQKFTAFSFDINKMLDRTIANSQVPKNKIVKEIESAIEVYFELSEDFSGCDRVDDKGMEPDMVVEITITDQKVSAAAFLFNSEDLSKWGNEPKAEKPAEVAVDIVLPEDTSSTTSPEATEPLAEDPALVMEAVSNNEAEVQEVDEPEIDGGTTMEASVVDEGPFDLHGNYFYLKSKNGEPIDVTADGLRKYLVENNFAWDNFSNWLIDSCEAENQGVALTITVDDRINSDAASAQIAIMIGVDSNTYETTFHVRLLKSQDQRAKLGEKTFLITDEEVDDLNFKVATDRYDSLDNSGPVFLQLTHEGETKF